MLPPGVSQSAFDAAIRDFTAALGRDQVFTDESDLALYRDPYTPFRGIPDRELVASAAVAPTSTEQVQAVVRIANKHGIPLYATSTGRNLGYGGASPTLSGSVVVDLKRMNRVIEVNAHDAYAIIEPGLSFIEFSKYLQDHNLPFMVSAAENGAGGPVGNAMDHGVGLVGDNFGRVCGLEVVLPNGEVMRTGSGAVPNAKLWPVYRYGYGPSVEGLFPQSNFGIVTKAVFWLEPQPERFQGFSVSSSRADDFGPLIAAVQMLRHSGTIFNSSAFSPLRQANNASVGMKPRGIAGVDMLLAKADGGTSAEWDALAKETNIPVSMVGGRVKGPKLVVEATMEYLKEHFAKFPNATFTPGKPYDFPIDPETVPIQDRLNLGFPNLWGFWRLANQGMNHGHYYFSPNVRADAEDMLEFNRVMRKAIGAFDAPDVLKRWGWQGGSGSFPKTFTVFYDFVVTDDATLNARYLKVFEHMVRTAADHGWAEYRAPAAFQDLIQSVYSYNDGALRRFAETMKDAIDPNGILSPGRGGIWPKKYRKG